ncbi:MAG: DUF302 domain-containing protein [Sulfitobacter sp.]|jgi:uncharacterized protein (DUF302 family)|uniref:DUF302 domain-containing protein n=1 Tax=Sulfitobacter sp. TaxID=1903071 RepID=UPI000C0E6146|nr:DUF302 domain-containing protein [Roseobacter sp.]MBV47833.1 DUF302 domain-containing protein [Roseobacter sp.]PHR09650.1 MAG: DUF302 domain-containing protein [Sulfitobacter sp.]THF93549.1 MAG: DUF302 domain-containing protein [Sulfitobacter sp. SK025]|tara:strand:+ start:2895 stop:3332 length:438 start_codon:yes stop_codon:yes gene_type:complete
MRQVLCAAAIYALSTPVFAEGQAITYDYDGSFEDATFAVENAIIGKGLVVDYVSHTGEMLNRTGPDVGSDVEIFKAADVYLFCSAVVSRRVMEADPMNIVHCPYSIFVADIEGKVTVGYPTFPDGPMQEVQALLDEITKTALDGF